MFRELREEKEYLTNISRKYGFYHNINKFINNMAIKKEENKYNLYNVAIDDHKGLIKNVSNTNKENDLYKLNTIKKIYDFTLEENEKNLIDYKEESKKIRNKLSSIGRNKLLSKRMFGVNPNFNRDDFKTTKEEIERNLKEIGFKPRLSKNKVIFKYKNNKFITSRKSINNHINIAKFNNNVVEYHIHSKIINENDLKILLHFIGRTKGTLYEDIDNKLKKITKFTAEWSSDFDKLLQSINLKKKLQIFFLIPEPSGAGISNILLRSNHYHNFLNHKFLNT